MTSKYLMRSFPRERTEEHKAIDLLRQSVNMAKTASCLIDDSTEYRDDDSARAEHPERSAIFSPEKNRETVLWHNNTQWREYKVNGLPPSDPSPREQVIKRISEITPGDCDQLATEIAEMERMLQELPDGS